MNLFKKVAWCVVDDPSTDRANLTLLDWLRNVQYYSKKRESSFYCPRGDKLFLIEDKYWLRENEFDYARQILKEYQQDLIRKYFANHLVVYPFTRKSTEAEYFFTTLEDFLEEHECEKVFAGNQMYIRKEHKERGSCEGTPLEANYQLTDFAVVYYKMYLIVKTYSLTWRKNPMDTNTLSYRCVVETKHALDAREARI